MTRPRSSTASLLLLILAAPATADDWPSWRGPKRDGVSAERDLPSTWGPEANILWKTPLPGAAGSTPVIAKDRIFLTSPSADAAQLLLLCLGTDGKPRWERSLAKGLRDPRNLASASPSTDGVHVWAYAGTGDLACFTMDGDEVWRAQIQERYGRFKLGFGMTTTPLLHEGVLYLQLIHSGGAWVLALEAASGKELWKTERKSDGVDECEHSYASIQFWPGGVLISHGNDYTIGHDPKTGAELWRLGDLNPKEKYNRTLRFVSSPLVTPDLIVVPTAKGGAVVALDPRAKGRIDRENVAHQKWRVNSGTPDVASPLVYDGIVYLSDNSGALTALDAATGAQLYKQRPDKDNHFASPAAGDGKIYLAGRSGAVSAVAAGREFKVLSVNKLPDAFDASPAISGGRIYLRGAAQLWAIGSK
jgi:outer membrane protein assembly factor BamB